MLFSAILLPSCDSWSFWQSGNYEVYAIDDSTRREFGVNLGGGGIQGLVEPIVVGIGEDTRWIVIKRHPDGDRTRTEFFYLAKLDEMPALFGPEDDLVGESDFGLEEGG
jgi:hypothetical protein